ncbi:MAG: hypothetical protein ACP6KW_11285 [Candidatus Thorarchaeota archaeon]
METIVCSGCSLLCNDVSAEVSGKSVNSLGLCRLGHTHLETVVAHTPRSDEKALEKAADILLDAENLLVYGWNRVPNEAIDEGKRVADILHARFATSTDWIASQVMSHSIHSGGLEVDLEYVRNNGEFIVYWGSDPAESLHRHASRFAVLPRGEKVPEGIESRTIGVVDVRETETMKMANHRLILPPGSDSKLLDAVISELEGKASIKGDVLGVPGTELVGFVRGLQKSDCTVIFYGSGIVNSGNHEANLSGIARLVEVLRNSGKEAYALPMFVQSNTMGAARGMLEGGPSSSILQRIISGEYDTVLVVGDDVLADLPGVAARAIASSRVVYVGPPGGLTDKRATVSVHTVDPMVAGSESMTRVDMTEVEFKKWKGCKDGATISEVLRRLHELVVKKKE